MPRRGARGTSGLDKRSRKERGAGRQLLGRGRRPGCRARDALARRTKPPLCEPRPSPPRWETAQGGFLGQAGSRGRVPPPPTAPRGWGLVRLARGLHTGAMSSQEPLPPSWRLGLAGMQCGPQCQEDAAAPPPCCLGSPRGEQRTCPSLRSQGVGVPRNLRSLPTAQLGPAVLLAHKGRMTRQGVGASTSGLLSCCPACPCPSRPQRPGRVIPGHTLAAGTSGGAEPLWLAQGGGHVFGPPYLQHPAR